MSDSTVFNELVDKSIKHYWLLNNSEQFSRRKLIRADNAWLLLNEINKEQPVLTQPPGVKK
ncbi:MAG: hypothetical protein COV52_09785 [Gammaproteobacteria bacterium CG11_big_fil_rev_8_21_14_0_20_46_22]|nr:MAG: hypothetical protein COV52_09785 [Gammaproteobacteria bacterium CG11_big_fil_rev_8_21_14_0_20_46_22]